MSWLPSSLTNSLLTGQNPGNNEKEEDVGAPSTSDDPNRGVKEDLSELTETLTRQFRGFATFLAPPPSNSPPDADPDRDPTVSNESSPSFHEIRNDFVEIGGKFRRGISKLSSNLVQFGSEEEIEEHSDDEIEERSDDEIEERSDDEIEERSEEGIEERSEEEIDEHSEEIEEEENVIGVTEEVLTFARNIAMHPETWLDFPLFHEFEDTIDFKMSANQQEHAQAVVNLEPRLAALKIELCPAHMTEGCFWKIYFVLLHSRLNKDDAKLLATPQIDEARAMLLQKLHKRSKSDTELLNRSQRNTDYTTYSPRASEIYPSNLYTISDCPTSHSQNEKNEVETKDISPCEENAVNSQNRDKNIVSDFSVFSIHDYDDTDYDWLHEEEVDVSRTIVSFGNEDDVSFSDLEDEDELKPPLSSSKNPKQ